MCQKQTEWRVVAKNQRPLATRSLPISAQICVQPPNSKIFLCNHTPPQPPTKLIFRAFFFCPHQPLIQIRIPPTNNPQKCQNKIGTHLSLVYSYIYILESYTITYNGLFINYVIHLEGV